MSNKDGLEVLRAHFADREKAASERMKTFGPETTDTNEANRMYWTAKGEENAFGAMAGMVDRVLKGLKA